MLVIKDLHKYYKSTKGESYHALKGINLEFGNKGFVVILGKSGSGKSTLLNILGGLDSYDNGEIIIKGKDTKDFNRNEWDSYRNTYVGFVFQEFYIIEEFTVGKNIALSLELQGNSKDEINTKVEEILHQVDLDGYANRKPSEISGGQKQRIAMARALVKDPKIILADEPTGNLDSETGKLILDTLKELSKEKLVIMVTHDAEFARMYGDRIIELKDGQVINDIQSENSNQKQLNDNESFELKKTSLSFKNTFKLAISSLFTKKLRLTLMTLLFITSLVFVGVATTFTFYDYATVSNLTFKNDGIEYIPLIKQREYCIGEGNERWCYNKEAKVIDTDIESYREQFPSLMFTQTFNRNLNLFRLQESNRKFMDDYRYYYAYGFNKITLLDGVNEMFALRLGEYPTKIGEVLISDYMATVIVDVGIIEGVNSLDDLIDQKLFDDDLNKAEFIISGIVKTDYERFNNLKQSTNPKDFQEDLSFEQKRDIYYKHIYMTKETFEKKLYYPKYLPSINGKLKYSDYQNSFNIFIHESSPIMPYVPNLLICDSQLPNEKNEIVISINFIEEAFPFIQFDWNDLENNEDLLGLIGQTFEYTIDVYKDGETKKESLNFKVVGIVDYPSFTSIRYNDVIVSKEMFEYIDKVYLYPENLNYQATVQILTKLEDNDKNNLYLLRELESLNYKHNTEYSKLLYQVDNITTGSQKLLYTIGVVFVLFSSFMVFTFISSSIKRKQKEIGTLRSIGAKGIDVSKIFIFEGLIIAFVSSVIAIIIYEVIVHLIIRYITIEFNTSLILLYVNPLSILIIFVLSMIVVIISSYFPVKRITKMKPICAIKKG